ncbi:hypothetical protein PSTG_18659, partial [Puccinia striiformis f. sp. tritici PST-78]
HWYNNCVRYWELVWTGVIAPPLKEFKSSTSAGQHVPVPPTQQSQLCQLDVPKASDKKFLLDSGVSTHGTIKIPTINGTIEVNDMYYCPGVDGVILL